MLCQVIDQHYLNSFSVTKVVTSKGDPAYARFYLYDVFHRVNLYFSHAAPILALVMSEKIIFKT